MKTIKILALLFIVCIFAAIFIFLYSVNTDTEMITGQKIIPGLFVILGYVSYPIMEWWKKKWKN
jgi:hypothetical protein